MIVRWLIGAALFAGSTPTSAAVPCESWAFVAVNAQQNGRIEVCSAFLASVPRLAETIDRMNAAAEKNADAARRMDDFVRTMNAMTRQMRPQDVNRLATTLSARVQEYRKEPDADLLGQIDRLRRGMEEINNKLDAANRDRQVASQASAALAGSAGKAIGELDLDKAQQMLDAIVRIEAKVDRIDRHVDAIANPAEAKALLVSDRQRMAVLWDSFVASGGQIACRTLSADAQRLFDEITDAERRENYQGARKIIADLHQRITMAAYARRVAAAQRLSDETRYEQAVADARRATDLVAQELAGRETDLVEKERFRAEVLRHQIASQQKELSEMAQNERDAVAELKRTEQVLAAMVAKPLEPGYEERRQSELRVARENRDGASSGLKQLREVAAVRRAQLDGERAAANWPASATSSYALLVDEARLRRDRLAAATAHLAKAIDEAASMSAQGRTTDAANRLRDATSAAYDLKEGRTIVAPPALRSSTNDAQAAACY